MKRERNGKNIYEKRGHSYEKMCRNMAFDLGIKLWEEDGVVYQIKDEEGIEVCKATNPKSVWFETWLIMRERIADSDFRDKDYTLYR